MTRPDPVEIVQIAAPVLIEIVSVCLFIGLVVLAIALKASVG